MTTPQDLDDRFRETLGALPEPERRCDPAQPVRPGAALTGRQLLALFDAQVTSRQLDLAGRWLRSFDEGFYTIGSAGHEANAAVAAALRPTDPALLHYRSGAFYCLRAAQAAGVFPGGGTPAEGVPDRDADTDPATTAPHPDGVPVAGHFSDGVAAAGHLSDGAAAAGDFSDGVAAAGQPSDGAAAAGDGDDALGPPPGADPEPVVTDDPRAVRAGVPDAPDGVAVSPPPAGPVTYRVGADGTAEPVPRHRPTPTAAGPVPAVTDPAQPSASTDPTSASTDPASTDPALTDPASTGPGHTGTGHTGPGDVTPAGVADRGAVAGTPSAPADRPASATGPAERSPGDRDEWEQAYAEAARDVLSGMVASARDPIAGGRHKVFGRADLAVVPTTSTIASHLPRAVGLGLAVERLRRIDTAGRRDDPAGPPRSPWPRDAIVVCSFGDASVNHASATAAFNTAGWYDHTGLRIPVLFVCEDNGLGISVRSPDGWVERTLRARPGVRYFTVDGTDPVAAYAMAAEAAGWVRRHRRPAVLHLRTVRLLGHAGADAERAYRSTAEIAADEARDPVLATARLLVEAGVATGEELLARYDEQGWQVRRTAEEVLDEPKLATPAEVVAPLSPRRPLRVATAVARAAERAAGPDAASRAEAFGGRPPELAGPLTLAQSINAALADGMLSHPQLAVFGEDVAAKGGVYGVTKGLRERFGAARVFDTLLDETSVLGLGLGAGLAGMLPVPEIQYLAYLHNAEDQLRGEAATMQFFSQGAFRNPMVVRVPGLAYQEGFGGHFHNDNSVAVLRDVPGLVVAVPARPDDAAPLLRTCLAAAVVDGTVSVFLEPIALYHTRDLYEPGDGEWMGPYPEPGAWAAGHVPIGRARVYGVGSAEDITIVTFGNGVRMSLRAASTLADEGIGSRVVDLRWLAPLPVADLIREASATGRVLVVDETRRSGGVGEGILATLVDAGYVGAARRVAAVDSFVPLGPAARQVLVSEDAITQGARTLLAR
ncbi:thiamine pyrophosphate-dependent enzyme [Micromonospora sp. WMMD714]|uniref:thiamine pyrophosphate-dependent enzyme n=1 Tax=Micromonospora sp. WMMD714 TaxID=3016097 RepID=UPI00249A474C|nr:thiamine pyrophosphate-dependent enzyme [Micromonospora sp. WMMD714]WFE67218.1 thiamine pyrophosphate-dependent enzyme [Micromonospora sp. WMMD714]